MRKASLLAGLPFSQRSTGQLCGFWPYDPLGSVKPQEPSYFRLWAGIWASATQVPGLSLGSRPEFANVFLGLSPKESSVGYSELLVSWHSNAASAAQKCPNTNRQMGLTNRNRIVRVSDTSKPATRKWIADCVTFVQFKRRAPCSGFQRIGRRAKSQRPCKKRPSGPA